MMKKTYLWILMLLPAWAAEKSAMHEADVVIYGGTSAAITAAVQVKNMGRSVIIVSTDKYLGGLSSGGLGWTDTGNKAAIGGLARDFYHRIWKHYQQDDAWKWQKKDQYGNKGQGSPAIDGTARTMWIFEPHVAEKVFEEMLREKGIDVHRDEWLDRKNGVVKEGAVLRAFKTLSGAEYRGKMFLDVTYEGDLMAAAGVRYHVGREANAVYQETWNGVQEKAYHHAHGFHIFPKPISPYVVPGDPSSGVLPYISKEPIAARGSGDNKIQAYCFRMCLSRHPENRIPFAKPQNYDPKNYELLVRIYEAGWKQTFGKFDPIPNLKTDTNNHGPFSTDFIGMNYEYPEASYEKRREIIQQHRDYQQGWLYFLSNDPRVPAAVRKEMQQWGLPKDEFLENGGWSRQLYIREARRMIGSMVVTENHLTKKIPTPESIGMGSYAIDSHNVQRYITSEGAVANEGDIGVHLKAPYDISYGSILPDPKQAVNLLVPVCVSSSHIAYGSIRMEPVFMILGQSAATAAVLSLEKNISPRALPYASLRERLISDEQVLEIK